MYGFHFIFSTFYFLKNKTKNHHLPVKPSLSGLSGIFVITFASVILSYLHFFISNQLPLDHLAGVPCQGFKHQDLTLCVSYFFHCSD